ncbi:unnamed protein product [Amoebophrya sp. A25]|nr:unnamed protein product [Amoebophrya sp. A25]|eukprot:GSA25T00008050001.1
MTRLKLMQPWLWNPGGHMCWMDDAPNDVSAGLQIRDYVQLKASQIRHLGALDNRTGGAAGGDGKPFFSKVLVCAPSNAAIDEIVRRLTTEGIFGKTGKQYKPVVVRLGPGIHESLKRYSLEFLASERARAKGLLTGLNKAELDPIKRELLQEANVVCTTCSVAGSRDVLNFGHAFESVIIDEAAQGVEVATLVPLVTGCKRLVLVGDPKQLPATVFSGIAKRKGYDRSLFQRLAEDGYPVARLLVQYRMHPFISAFPSQKFYEGQLGDFRDRYAFEAQYASDWWELPMFGPISFFNVSKGQEAVCDMSIVNEREANFVILLYKTLVQLYPHHDWRKWCGVISPYEKQVSLLKKKFRELYRMSPSEPCPVEVKTVDGFQGSEKELIIFSLVRARGAEDRKSKGIGFLKDMRRMNVGMTRARRSLFMVGHAETLKEGDKTWKDLVQFCSKKFKTGFHTVNGDDERRWMATAIRKFLRSRKNRVPTEEIRKTLREDLASPTERQRRLELARTTDTTSASALQVLSRKRQASDEDDEENADGEGGEGEEEDAPIAGPGQDDGENEPQDDNAQKITNQKNWFKMQVETIPWLSDWQTAASDSTCDVVRECEKDLFTLSRDDIETLVAKEREEEQQRQTEAEFARELDQIIREKQKAADAEKAEKERQTAKELAEQQNLFDEAGGDEDVEVDDGGADDQEMGGGDDDDGGAE